MEDGRIAYVDFGNVAELSSGNKQVLIDAVVHAVNEDYEEMARDFIKLVSRPGVCAAAACLCRRRVHQANCRSLPSRSQELSIRFAPAQT